MRAHFAMCYMITKITKKMLKATGRPIRIKRLIQDFSYVENLAKRRKYPVRMSAYMIYSCEQYK
jgi:3-hydroxyisobutyrate dehydrogenase-like beta-hydroxyacid dehydrogenase